MDRRTVILTFGASLAGASHLVRSMAAAAGTKSVNLPASSSSSSAFFTGSIAYQDPAGGTVSPPNYESVHLMTDERIASIGWTGIHRTEHSNAIYAFNPDTGAVDLLAPWEQYVSAQDLQPKIPPVREGGYNKHCSTYDNHPSAYFAATNTLVWFGHCVFDVTGQKYIRGNRPPQTSNWQTYATGHNAMWSTYNPAYAQCPALNVVAFYGSSHGGYGTPNTGIVVWRKTGPESAPWQATVTNLAGQGMLPITTARNNAACLGTKMYVGGGSVGPPVAVSDSVFTKAGHGYHDEFEFSLFPNTGQEGVPQGMTVGRTYYVRDATPNTFRITDSRGGKAIKVAEKSGSLGIAQNYRMWAIDLNDLTVELVSTEWGLGVSQYYPQLLADTLRNRLVLIGKTVSEFNPATKVWNAIPVKDWPSDGFKSVGGAHVARYDKVFFRGTRRSGPAEPTCWQWNSIAFAGGKAATPPQPPRKPVSRTGEKQVDDWT